MQFDAEYDGSGGPRVDLYKGDGASTIMLQPGGGEASQSGGGLMRLGEFDRDNLVIDENEILARTNSVAAPLYLNYGYSAPVVMTRLAINTAAPATGYSLSVDGKIIANLSCKSRMNGPTTFLPTVTSSGRSRKSKPASSRTGTCPGSLARNRSATPEFHWAKCSGK